MSQPENQPKDQTKSLSKDEPETRPEVQSEPQPKRVILRLSECNMGYQNPREFVDFYFKNFPLMRLQTRLATLFIISHLVIFRSRIPKSTSLLIWRLLMSLRICPRFFRMKYTKFAAGLITWRCMHIQNL
ncbi:hypothetical protein BJX62DRAFT_47630 [Aspergillus germanicus]